MDIVDKFFFVASQEEIEKPKSFTSFLPPPGYYKFNIASIDTFESKKDGTNFIKLVGYFDGYEDKESFIYIACDVKFLWKVRNLFKSANVYEKCFRNGQFLSDWNLLIGNYCFCVIDEKGVKNFITEEEYIKVS